MTHRQRQAREAQIKGAMSELISNPNFQAFIELLKSQREAVIEDACTESTVASQRASMAAIGELRAYKSIISIYDEAISQAEEERNRQQDAVD